MSPFTFELLIFSIAATVVTSAFAYGVYWVLNDSPASNWLHDSDAIAPAFLSITSFIFGLAISTLASSSFERHLGAVSNQIIESSAIETIISASEMLSQSDSTQLNLKIKNYLTSVIDKEWAVLQERDPEKQNIAAPEFLALNKTVTQIAYKPNQQVSISSQLLSAIDSIRRARYDRQALAFENNSIRRWPVIPVCSLLLLISVGIVHLGSKKAMKVSLGIASLCIVTAAIFLYSAMSPYRGLNVVEPIKFEAILEQLK